VGPRNGFVAVDRMKQLHGIESGPGDMSMTVRESAMRRRRSTGGGSFLGRVHAQRRSNRICWLGGVGLSTGP
jgi:hypothetical protein